MNKYIQGFKTRITNTVLEIAGKTWIKISGAYTINFLIVLAIVISLISLAFMLIPVIGQVIQILIQIALGGFLTSLLIAAMLGLYYRYEVIDTEPDVMKEQFE